MANTSISAAFERMWQHIVSALSNKAEKSELTQYATVEWVKEYANSAETGSYDYIVTIGDPINLPVYPEGEQEIRVEPEGILNAYNDGGTWEVNAIAAGTCTIYIGEDMDLHDNVFRVLVIDSSNNTTGGTANVEDSEINGNIKIDGVETVVYTHPNKHSISEVEGLQNSLDAKANTSDIPTKVSQLTNDKNYLTSYTETDPTVPSWAKASTKPSYTKSEVGLGNVDNVKQYSASNPPPYPVTKVNNKTGAVTLTASDVGADASGTASSAVSTHNSDSAAHADIREQISQLSSEIVDEIITMTEAEYNAQTKSSLRALYARGVRLIAVEMSNPGSGSGGGSESTIINMVPLSLDTDGNVFNGKGWMENTRLASNGSIKTGSDAGYSSVTGYIPATGGDVIRIKGVLFNDGVEYVCVYDSTFSYIGYISGAELSTSIGTAITEGDLTTVTLVKNSDIAWIRVSLMHSSDDAGYTSVSNPIDGPGSYMVVTINENESGSNSGNMTYTNQVLISIDVDGNVYNGIGYRNDYRINSSGKEAWMEEAGLRRCTGFIPCKAGDVIRFRYRNNINIWTDNTWQHSSLNFYKSLTEHLGQFLSDSNYYGIFTSSPGEVNKVSKVNGAWEYMVLNNSDISWVRLTVPMRTSGDGIYGDDLIVTINEEITEV